MMKKPKIKFNPKPSAKKKVDPFEIVPENEKKVVMTGVDMKPEKQDALAVKFTAISSRVENLDDLDEAMELSHIADQNYFQGQYMLGAILSVIYLGQWWASKGNYASFDEFVYANFGFRKRKAQYLIAIYEFIVQADAEHVDFIDIKPSLLREMATRLKPDDATKWLKWVDDNKPTVDEFLAALKHSEEGQALTDQVSPPKTSISFQFFPEQVDVVEAALNKAGVAADSSNKNFLLEMICLEYLGNAYAPDSLVEHLSEAMGLNTVIDKLQACNPDVSIQVASTA